MPKRVFWPAVIITIGLIVLASNLNMLPFQFANLWPLIAVTVGLGGLLLSDREEWDTPTRSVSAAPRRGKVKKSRR